MINRTFNIGNQPTAEQVIVQDYFNLVKAVATRIKRRLPAHVDVEDLIQTGMIGLLEASSRFDASRSPHRIPVQRQNHALEYHRRFPEPKLRRGLSRR